MDDYERGIRAAVKVAEEMGQGSVALAILTLLEADRHVPSYLVGIEDDDWTMEKRNGNLAS